jgi:hypothetical protein
MYYYAISLRKTSYPVFITDYVKKYDELNTKLGPLHKPLDIEYHFEAEAGLHTHGMIIRDRKVYLNSIQPGENWHMDFRQLYTKDEITIWEKYMRKGMPYETTLINKEYRIIHQDDVYYDEQIDTTMQEYFDLNENTYKE